MVLCWRPLIFWDEEQIQEIKKDQIEEIWHDINSLQNQIDDLENELDDYQSEIEDIINKICDKKWIEQPLQTELYKYY